MRVCVFCITPPPLRTRGLVKKYLCFFPTDLARPNCGENSLLWRSGNPRVPIPFTLFFFFNKLSSRIGRKYLKYILRINDIRGVGGGKPRKENGQRVYGFFFFFDRESFFFFCFFFSPHSFYRYIFPIIIFGFPVGAKSFGNYYTSTGYHTTFCLVLFASTWRTCSEDMLLFCISNKLTSRGLGYRETSA